MAKNTGKSHWERFAAAVTARKDESAEALVPLLTEADAAHLRAWLEASGDRRWWAVRALAEVGTATDVETIAGLLPAKDPALRSVALLALGRLHSRHPQAVVQQFPQIVNCLSDRDGLVRQTASDVLAQCGDDAVDALADALESDQDAIRVRAAAALHRIATPKTALPLYKHLDDPNPLVRHHAHEALDEMGYLSNVFFAP